jgi:hypothetical protein
LAASRLAWAEGAVPCAFLIPFRRRISDACHECQEGCRRTFVRDHGRVRFGFVSAWPFSDADEPYAAHPNAKGWD